MLCILGTAVLLSASASPEIRPEARILVVYPSDAAGNKPFMEKGRACESFIRAYFSSAADVIAESTSSPSPSAALDLAAKRNARWALVFSADGDDCVFRAYDCSLRSILTYENESAYEVDLDRGGGIDLWTGKNLYALLFQHVLDENRFFLSDAGASPDTRLIVGNFVTDDKSSAAFPDISKGLAAAIASRGGTLRPLSDADAHFASDFYRFIPYAHEITPHAKAWNARWYLGGTLFEDKGSYKLFLILIDAGGGSTSILCDTVFFSRDELRPLVAQSVEKASILIAGGSSGSSLENRSLAMVSEYAKGGQFPVYSFAPSAGGELYLSTMMSVLRFTPDGMLAGEVGSFGTGPGEFYAIYKVRADAQGNVYLLDYSAGKVL